MEILEWELVATYYSWLTYGKTVFLIHSATFGRDPTFLTSSSISNKFSQSNTFQLWANRKLNWLQFPAMGSLSTRKISSKIIINGPLGFIRVISFSVNILTAIFLRGHQTSWCNDWNSCFKFRRLGVSISGRELVVLRKVIFCRCLQSL